MEHSYDLLEEECCSTVEGRKNHHPDNVKSNLVSRLNQIEGQIRGIKG